MAGRMTPSARRAQLLEIATDLFARHPYDDVAMDQVARHAEVSRALLYRYFPGKRELFTAVYQAAADRLLDLTPIEVGAPVEPQVSAGLDAHIDYFVANRNAVLAANRTLSGDPVVQAIIADELAVLRDRVLAALEVPEGQRAAMASILTSWLTFVRVLCVDWLVRPTLSRRQLRDVCIGALDGALDGGLDGAVRGVARPERSDAGPER